MDTNKLVAWIGRLYREKNIRKFYVSKHWRKLRARVLKESKYECQMCKHRGKYARAIVVHHMEHVKDRPDLALTKSNLMSLCASCHNEVHPEKNINNFFKKNKNPREMLNEERW